jgi:hypothetical protein
MPSILHGTSVPVRFLRFLKDNKEVISYFCTLSMMNPTKIKKAAKNMQKMYEFMIKDGKTTNTLFNKCFFGAIFRDLQEFQV